MNRVVRTLITPAHPHPLLAPDRNPGWGRVRDAYEQAGAEIRASGADLIILYSTLWPSIIGHQIQADPNPVWNLVDPDFHALGTIDYDLRIDAEFAHAWDAANTARGLTSRTVAYHGFPIDVGSVVALNLLDPEGRIPAVICSSNVFGSSGDHRPRQSVSRCARTDGANGRRRRSHVPVEPHVHHDDRSS